jgi:HPr kinase/phosphorylase
VHIPGEEIRPEGITVREFVDAVRPSLELEVLHGGDALDRRILSPRIQKIGLALAGYLDYVHSGRVQLLGGSEINFLSILDPEARAASVRNLGRLELCCVVIAKGLEAPPGLLELALERSFPLLRTKALSSVAIQHIASILEMRLAPRATLHGVFMDVFGLGVLILGPSGIGKSECALELLLRGHRLIADDSVEISKRGLDRLVGSAGKILKHHMEIRGIGIIDVKELFGISVTEEEHSLELVVQLDRWRADCRYERLGLDRPTIPILGIPVPLIAMPVAPGRNISALVEVAARTQLLRKTGQPLSKEL